jgi:glycerol-3-phosphate acyltransferase PlsY
MVESTYLLVILYSYLLGSIPFGLILVKFAGYGDIRKSGSGNIGSTNVMRSAGKCCAALTFLLDAAKGLLAIYITNYYFASNSLNYLALAASVTGHTFPVWLNFKGGKGVATSFCGIFYLDNEIGFFLLTSWLMVLFISKYVSLASILAIIVVTLISVVAAKGFAFVALMFYLCFLVVFRHKDNIKRLIHNTEPRIR